VLWRVAVFIFVSFAAVAPNHSADPAKSSPIPEVELPNDSAISLANLPWEFYWEKLYTPKDFVGRTLKPDLRMQPVTIWNGQRLGGEVLGSFGYATYRLRCRVTTMGKRFGLRVVAPLTSYRLFVNDEILAEEGVVAKSAENSRARRKSSLVFFSTKGEDLEIVLQVSNFLLSKGGLRGNIELGTAEKMQAYGMRYLAVDLFSIGLIFSIMLYHFLLYILTRKKMSVLIFAFLALDYFILAFLFGEQSIALFLPDLDLSIHTRLSSMFIYVLPALVLEFTARLFPGSVPNKVRQFYWLLASIFIALLILPLRYVTTYNVFYYGIAGLSAGIWGMRGALIGVKRRLPGAILLVLGLTFLIALTVYAVYLYASHSVAGSFLSIGFSCFALFQSGSLAHNHSVLDRKNAEMHDRLERSREALETQRRQIEANLHDSLGGNLTDIKLALESLLRGNLTHSLKIDIKRLDARVAGTIASLRTELLFLEDLQLAMKDLVSGLNLILLRRYQMTRKPVEITITNETRDNSRRIEELGRLSHETKLELCLMVQELCNNNLKYGVGTANWRIQVAPKEITITLDANTRANRKKSANGLGNSAISDRAERIQANFTAVEAGRSFNAALKLTV
jgi:signal transduction histidine kinase